LLLSIPPASFRFTDNGTKILDTDPALHFALLRLQLIELIRTCTSTPGSDISPAINFASSQLAPRAATNPEFLRDLELTMSLLIFLPAEDTLQPQFAELLQPSLRRDVASRVNEAILGSMGARGEARLRNLVRLRIWAEEKARAAAKPLPPFLPLGLSEGEEYAGEGTGNHEVTGNHDSGDVMVS
jgi:glucose-induced degradation protein 8